MGQLAIGRNDPAKTGREPRQGKEPAAVSSEEALLRIARRLASTGTSGWNGSTGAAKGHT